VNAAGQLSLRLSCPAKERVKKLAVLIFASQTPPVVIHCAREAR
jgi:hypothetical protein